VVRAVGVEAADAAEAVQRRASWQVDTGRFLTDWLTQEGKRIQCYGDTTLRQGVLLKPITLGSPAFD
jgi:hypothetical protein